MEDYIQIQTTTNSITEAHTIARNFVMNHLVASVQVIPNMTSFYIWQEELCETQEYLLLINTTNQHIKSVEKALHEMHSYIIPEYIITPIIAGSKAYLQWIDDNTSARSQ